MSQARHGSRPLALTFRLADDEAHYRSCTGDEKWESGLGVDLDPLIIPTR
jgi:hypothetical protein